MSLFERISNLIRISIHDLIEGSRNPEAELERMVEKMENDLGDARLLLEEARSVQFQVESRKRVKEAEVEKWENKALPALEAGNESLAREALRRKIEAARRFAELQQEADDARKRLIEIEEQIRPLQEKLSDAQAALLRLIREKERAEREKAFQEIAATTGQGRLEAEEKLQDDGLRKRLEAEALLEEREGTTEARFQKMESPDSEIEKEMDRLRAKIRHRSESLE